MRQEPPEPLPPLPPHCCVVCGRDFSNEYFHTGRGGEEVAFADFDDSQAKAGCVPGVSGVAWICAEHVEAAQQRLHLPTVAAVRDMQRSFGVRAVRPPLDEPKPDPQLFLVDVGPNRAKVFAVVRQAMGCTPAEARALLDRVPFKVVEGWPMQFEPWRRALADAGAAVAIRWD